MYFEVICQRQLLLMCFHSLHFCGAMSEICWLKSLFLWELSSNCTSWLANCSTHLPASLRNPLLLQWAGTKSLLYCLIHLLEHWCFLWAILRFPDAGGCLLIFLPVHHPKAVCKWCLAARNCCCASFFFSILFSPIVWSTVKPVCRLWSFSFDSVNPTDIK